ncbi:protein FAM98C isoform X3 [Varanus komodoensis]|uniref:protein FAM98C isoform X3 n=1 Tax=Varanus komodoensis TaxID=61221 RepID=UPI001CF7C936|nr:protein FAM98C isoform X3 [Varanus komodoensis]
MEGGGPEGCLSMESFTQLAEAGISSPQFTAVCSWLVSELRTLCPLEEVVNPTHGPEDAETFQIEVSGLLSELFCPYPSLTSGDLRSRLRTPASCLQLLYFLSSELLAARLQARKKGRLPEEEVRAAEAVRELQCICQSLGMPRPDPACSIRQIMADVESKEALKGIQEALQVEYRCRLHMMITRFDVTIASFHWSERAKDRSVAMAEAFRPLRESFLADSQVTLAHLLAAREDFSRIVKTSSGATRDKTACAVNKVLMTGGVPDRGGRPNEIEPPMPVWEKRREGTGGGHQHRGKQGRKKKK